MDGLLFERDIRNADPDQSGHRRARFLDGWSNAVGGASYSGETLHELTWENLGYRLGKLFGPTDRDAIVELYEWCVRQQAGRRDA